MLTRPWPYPFGYYCITAFLQELSSRARCQNIGLGAAHAIVVGLRVGSWWRILHSMQENPRSKLM